APAPPPAAAGAPALGWSTAPLDASALGLIDGQVSFAAQSVDLGTTLLGPVRTLISIDRSRAVADLQEVHAFGGVLLGQFIVNNRSGLSVGGDIKANGVELARLLSDLGGITRFTGKGNAAVNFLGVGPSVAAIMNSLSGNGAIDFAKGTILGIDLDRLMRSGEVGGGTTVFDRLAAGFRLENGNLLNDDLVLEVGSIRAGGKGRVGLGARDIDYTVTPVAMEARDGRGIAIPVRVRGPWSSPQITPDLEAAIRLNFAEERKALEDKVRDEVGRKVGEELGVTPNEGESLEDAARRKLEEEARKGLRNLLKQ
ncbi:AsmA family protein, partial [Pseudooceanicola sp. 216_PA32_1]